MSAKVPSTLMLAARLSSGITSVVSITYIVLSVIGLISYFNCETVDLNTNNPAEYFWTTIFSVYLQNEDCPLKLSAPNLTQSYTMLVFMAITLSFSVVNLFTAITLTALINNEKMTQYINVYVYAYIGSWVATLVVDVTLATHLGLDITYLTDELNAMDFHIAMMDALRHGAFYLMSIALKGYVIYAIQLVLIVLIIIYLNDYQEMSKKDEHSIHKVGAINAFDQPRRPEESWTGPDMYAMEPFPRGHLNNNYVDDNPRLPQNDFYNNPRAPGSFRRSDSWNHQSGSSMQPTPTSSSARPFSYLEEVRRPAPVKPVAAKPGPAWPAPAPAPWAVPAPRVPAPDYSPHSSRRLKSALKTNYM